MKPVMKQQSRNLSAKAIVVLSEKYVLWMEVQMENRLK
jgi:hypothetical protein